MTEKYYTSTGEEYFPNATYWFTDQNGNVVESKGDNGYIWLSMTRGVPISIDENGDWYVTPYLSVTPDGIVSHLPQWFKETEEYAKWNRVYVPQINALGTSITKEQFLDFNATLEELGYQAMDRKYPANTNEPSASTEAATTTTTTTTQPLQSVSTPNVSNSSVVIFNAISMILAIIFAIVFASSVKEKIKRREEFSGVGWGLLNGVTGLGIIWVVLAHNSINKELAKVKNKKYEKYVRKQMGAFSKTYGVCLLVWIVVAIFIVMSK